MPVETISRQIAAKHELAMAVGDCDKSWSPAVAHRISKSSANTAEAEKRQAHGWGGSKCDSTADQVGSSTCTALATGCVLPLAVHTKPINWAMHSACYWEPRNRTDNST